MIRGACQEEVAIFTRQYIDGRTEHFNGKVRNNGEYWIIRGESETPGGLKGKFEMYIVAPDEMKLSVIKKVHKIDWNPPAVQTSVANPVIIVQLKQNNEQQKARDEATQELIEEIDIFEGETEDVKHVVNSLQRGVKMETRMIPDFVQRITQPSDLLKFLQAVKS